MRNDDTVPIYINYTNYYLDQSPIYQSLTSILYQSLIINFNQLPRSFKYLELLPEFEVEDLQCGPLVVPGAHLVHVRGDPGVRHTQNLAGQSTHKGDGVVQFLVARDGNGGRLVHRLPVVDLMGMGGAGRVWAWQRIRGWTGVANEWKHTKEHY